MTDLTTTVQQLIDHGSQLLGPPRVRAQPGEAFAALRDPCEAVVAVRAHSRLASHGAEGQEEGGRPSRADDDRRWSTIPFGDCAAIAVDSFAIYWTTRVEESVNGLSSVTKASLEAGTPTTLVSENGSLSNITVDRESIYWISTTFYQAEGGGSGSASKIMKLTPK